MIIFGSRASNIGNFDIPDTKCDYCGQESKQKISVFGRYAHIFWIPFFPIDKKAVAECAHCKRTIEQKDFSPELKQLYRENKANAKRPKLHWLGLGFIGLLIVSTTVIGLSVESDPRNDLLFSDIAKMTKNPTMESDSVSYKLKQIFNSFITEEIDASEFKYLTKIEGDKALILVEIPKLKKVEREARNEVIEMIEMVINEQSDLTDKKKFIGVKGNVTMMLIKTPTYERNSSIAPNNELYAFYGSE